jgi:hypothetical protein
LPLSTLSLEKYKPYIATFTFLDERIFTFHRNVYTLCICVHIKDISIKTSVFTNGNFPELRPDHYFAKITYPLVILKLLLSNWRRWNDRQNLHLFCNLLSVPIFLLVIVRSVLRFTNSNYLFGIFKLFLHCLFQDELTYLFYTAT